MPRKPKYQDFTVWLWEPDDKKHQWRVEFRPLHPTSRLKNGRPNTRYGECNWDKRIITINSRLRSPDMVWITLKHEVDHATLGKWGSEDTVVALEENFERALRGLRRKGD